MLYEILNQMNLLKHWLTSNHFSRNDAYLQITQMTSVINLTIVSWLLKNVLIKKKKIIH